VSRRLPARAAWAGGLALSLLLAMAEARRASAESAVDVETARAFFVEAAKLGSEGRWKEARELYARSLLMKPAAITRYSLGVAQKETGRLADALGSFRAFLADPPAPATARYAEPARAAIAELEGRVGRVTIAISPHPVEGLTLAIDGQPASPALDHAREIDPGAHEVVARAPGFHATTTRFSVVAGGVATVAIALPRLTKMGASQAISDTPAGLPPLSDSTPLDSPPLRSKTPPILLMGSGGALLLAGMTLGLIGVKQASLAPTRDGPEASAARAMGIAGDVIGGAGVATVGVGLVLLLTRGAASPPRAGGMRPSVSASGPGIGLRF
jgi:hypothetical protein